MASQRVCGRLRLRLLRHGYGYVELLARRRRKVLVGFLSGVNVHSYVLCKGLREAWSGGDILSVIESNYEKI